jgi:hypothetical protein
MDVYVVALSKPCDLSEISKCKVRVFQLESRILMNKISLVDHHRVYSGMRELTNLWLQTIAIDLLSIKTVKTR